ncbi:hypothetical protein DL98DRAFT_592745 [Cadophora sp. DSE1049]|nr:hypothetical protein DL98DRAFT_592745 [Cadophora sp. DSE1049]
MLQAHKAAGPGARSIRRSQHFSPPIISPMPKPYTIGFLLDLGRATVVQNQIILYQNMESAIVQAYDPDSGIDVFDVTEGATSIHTSLRYPLDSPDCATDPQLFATLDNVPDGCFTGILVLYQRDSCSHIHRGTYNAIGRKCGIDPRFFETHFSLFITGCHLEEDEDVEDEDKRMERRSLPWLAPSEKCFLQIKPNRWAHLIATGVQLQDLQVFIIFEYDLKHNDLHSAVKSVVEALAPSTTPVMSPGHLNLLEICSSYVRSSLRSTSDE